MSPQPSTSPVSRRQQPVRVRLARIAQNCAMLDPGVAGLVDGDGRWSTPLEDGGAIDGVLVVAAPNGGYSVEVHLSARIEPLLALTRRVQGRIIDAAAELGLLEELTRVHVTVEDLGVEEAVA